VVRHIVGVLLHFVRGTAQTVAESRLAAWLAGGGADEHDDATPYLEREATAMFTAGLDILLDGVEAATVSGPAGTRTAGG
jgi:hypothetical protein